MMSVYANKTLTQRTEWRSLVASVSLNFSRNSLKEKCYLISNSTLRIIYGKAKGMQEKVSIMGVVVAVALLYYVHGKHLRSCQDGKLT